MSFIAEYTIDSPVMKATHEAAPEMILEMQDLQLLGGGRPRYVFWAWGGDFQTFEAAMADDPYVESFSLLTTVVERRLYRVNFSERVKSKMTYPEASKFDIVFLGATSTSDGVHFRAQIPTRAVLGSFREKCEAKGLTFRLDSIYQEGGDEGKHQYGLTDPQLEAILLAHERGYYGAERDVSLEELASELDISRQAFAARLRRGQERLVDNTLADNT